jgi:apolipoprotein N-acyltransferase
VVAGFLARHVSGIAAPIANQQPKESAMRTVIIILGGFVLWGVCLGVVKLLAKAETTSMTAATVAFVAIWFLAAASNMWIGVSQAGYSIQDELPIFLLIFLLPAAVAVFFNWKLL